MKASTVHRADRFLLPILCLVVILALVPAANAAGNTEGAAQAIIQGFQDNAQTIDLTGYTITRDQLAEIFQRDKDAGKYPWYADGYSYSYYTDTGYVTSFTYKNLDPKKYDYELYEQKVAEILNATVLPGMSDWQAALAIHDYLAAHNAYDETYTYYEGYDAIVRGTSVCNGYTEAYMDLLNRIGIPCHKVISDGMNHNWNLVYISGNWFHVDVTWDDPISNTEGLVLHDYFLISDEAISDEEHRHYGWETDITCSFTEWDSDLFWDGVDSAICYESDDVCYLRIFDGETGYTLYSLTASTDTWRVITSYDSGYIDIGASTQYDYFYYHYGLSLYNGKLYYCDMGNVYSINPDGSGQKTVYTHDYSSEKTYIAGCQVKKGILYLTFSNHNGDLTHSTKDLGISQHTHSYTKTVVSATCISKGYTRYSCSCGVSYDTDETPLADHSCSVKTVKPTCTAKGYDHHVCSVCGDSYKDNYTDPKHSHTKKTVKPTCSAQGYDEYTCSACGHSYKDNYTAMTDHTYDGGTVITPATETAAGLMRYTCTACGSDKDVSIPKLDPQPPETEPQPPETEPQPPETEPQPPETEPQPPETEPQPPETEPQPPETEPQPPETEPQPPETEPQPPETEPQSPETEPSEDQPEPTPGDGTVPSTEQQTSPTQEEETEPSEEEEQDDPGDGIHWGRVALIAVIVIAALLLLLLLRKKTKKTKTPPAAPVTPPPAVPVRFCPHCGQQLEPNCRFCPRCGAKRPE